MQHCACMHACYGLNASSTEHTLETEARHCGPGSCKGHATCRKEFLVSGSPGSSAVNVLSRCMLCSTTWFATQKFAAWSVRVQLQVYKQSHLQGLVLLLSIDLLCHSSCRASYHRGGHTTKSSEGSSGFRPGSCQPGTKST